METFLQDIRFGFRQLLRKPRFAARAMISMALGTASRTPELADDSFERSGWMLP